MEVADLGSVKDILDSLEQLSLDVATKEELIALYNALKLHVAIVEPVPVGTIIARSVSCKYLEGTEHPIPTCVGEISYNPHLDKCGFNRASWEGETAFYGSVSSALLESYHTSGFEVLSNLNNSNNYLDKESFVIGKWVVKKEMSLIHVSGTLKHNQERVAARNNALNETLNTLAEHEEALRLIDHYLIKQFSKTVNNSERWQYKTSAAYAAFIHHDNWPGIIFPSVSSDGAGTNVVLFPEYVDEYLSLERAAYVTYYKRGDNIVDEITMDALLDGQVLRWKDNYNERLPYKMKRWYIGHSDDDSFARHIPFTNL